MRIRYKYRLLGYFFVLLLLFGGAVVYFQRKMAKNERVAALENRLDGYCNVLYSIISSENITIKDMGKIRQYGHIFPDSARISIIDNKGRVIYDNVLENSGLLPNHINRPEIRSAIYKSYGFDLRKSGSTNREYLYYARQYPDYFIRVALPFNNKMKTSLEEDNSFTWTVFILVILLLGVLYTISNRLSHSVSRLKSMAEDIINGHKVKNDWTFPNNELGDIAKVLFNIIEQRESANQKLIDEREKLIQHFKHSQNGLAIFAEDQSLIYANSHFYQLINFITPETTFNLEDLLKLAEFEPIRKLLKDKTVGMATVNSDQNGKHFETKINLFNDLSFEIVIRDITEQEDTHIIKQEMTSNIAHELRTPVTSIRGFLETLNENKDKMTDERRDAFIEKAYNQSVRLSQLIDDVSLLSKIEGNKKEFEKKTVDLHSIINECRIELKDRLDKKNIDLKINPDGNWLILGNELLLHSIFFNLIENSIKYAGEGIAIRIQISREDGRNLYITYYDTGKGVDEKHFQRLFERFYRISEGRTREEGGSGLGLAIVMNAIKLHNGDIQVKSHNGGGLEYLIRLQR